MPDYKEMYLKMVRATEKALDILIKAQQECEELYLSAADKKDDSKTPPHPWLPLGGAGSEAD